MQVIQTSNVDWISILSWLQQYLNSAKMTEAGPLDLLDADSDSDKEDLSLPGVLKGEHLLEDW